MAPPLIRQLNNGNWLPKAEAAYGVPPEQVASSSIKAGFELCDGRRLGLIVRHDDAEREYGYDRESHVGRLEGAERRSGGHWVVVSMKSKWATVFPDDPP
jgi:hypothetical protein